MVEMMDNAHAGKALLDVRGDHARRLPGDSIQLTLRSPFASRSEAIKNIQCTLYPFPAEGFELLPKRLTAEEVEAFRQRFNIA